MTTTFGLRKILDRKQWEFCTPLPTATTPGSFISSSRHFNQRQLYSTAANIHFLYDPREDGWAQIPTAALAGTFGAGTCCASTAKGPAGSATAGTTTTLSTNLTLARDLRGYGIRITGGPGAGDERTIASNTTGANGVVTVTSAFSEAITSSSTFQLLTPRWYMLNGGTLVANSFKAYDLATNTWSASLSITGAPPTLGTDAKLISTPSIIDGAAKTFATGTATDGATSTLTNSAKDWATNQWANFQVRITDGTGAGQIRSIASNTGTALTTSSAWATTPDATSQYAIEGNDDYLYLMGNNATAMYRYSISGNSWLTLSPAAARGGPPSLGMSGHWVYGATDAAWSAENDIINGRRIYSFRGGVTALVDFYDIAANTWISALPYAPAAETFTTGTKWIYHGDFLYCQKDISNRWFRFNVVTSEQDGIGTALYPQGGAIVGDTAFDVTYKDGDTSILFLHMGLNTSNVMLRLMVI